MDNKIDWKDLKDSVIYKTDLFNKGEVVYCKFYTEGLGRYIYFYHINSVNWYTITLDGISCTVVGEYISNLSFYEVSVVEKILLVPTKLLEA